ncbi:hypothetical protein Tco_1245448 [Tanacetum coccineum]
MKSAKDVTEEEATEYEKEKEELRNISCWERWKKKTFVQERFQDHPLEGHDLLLWGDLRMIFDLDEKDELWMNQLDWKLLRWKLYESCGVHTLFMDEAEEESTMAVELIKGRIVENSELLLLVLIYYYWFRVDAAAKD